MDIYSEGYSPAMIAARLGEIRDLIHHLTIDNVNDIHEETEETALTLASYGGHILAVDLLIDAGADTELGSFKPLMQAAMEGHYVVSRFLITAGAKVNAESPLGDTALTFAAHHGFKSIVELLLRSKAEIDHQSCDGQTPLMRACRSGHLEVVKVLVAKGADVNKQSRNNEHTPLSLACVGGHHLVVEYLITVGANPHHKLKDNSTMLIEAAKGGHTKVALILLNACPENKPVQSNKKGKKRRLPTEDENIEDIMFYDIPDISGAPVPNTGN